MSCTALISTWTQANTTDGEGMTARQTKNAKLLETLLDLSMKLKKGEKIADRALAASLDRLNFLRRGDDSSNRGFQRAGNDKKGGTETLFVFVSLQAVSN